MTDDQIKASADYTQAAKELFWEWQGQDDNPRSWGTVAPVERERWRLLARHIEAEWDAALALLREVRDLPLYGFVQCAWIDTRETPLPDAGEVEAALGDWEKRADALLRGDR